MRFTKYQKEIVELLDCVGCVISTVGSNKYFIEYNGERLGNRPVPNRTVHSLVAKGTLVVHSPGKWLLKKHANWVREGYQQA